MEQNQIQNQSQNNQIQEEVEKPFCERPFEEVEDGYIDDRGFYTTPNGSFWDDDQTYFNHLGFDRHGGSYDKYGIYQPGPDYDEKTGLYKDQKDLFSLQNEIKENEFGKNSISKLREQEKKDEKTIKKYEQPVEESEDEDDEDKSNITFDEEDIKEAYEDVMQIENNSKSKEKEKDKDVLNVKLTTVKPDENNDDNMNNIQIINDP